MANKSLCDFDVDGELKATSLDINGAADISSTLSLSSANYNEHLKMRRGSYGYDTIITGTRIDLQPTSATDTFKFLADLQTTGVLTGASLDVNGNADISGNLTSSTSSTIGTPKIIMQADGTLDWGAAKDYGTLTWDTGYALIDGQSGKGIKFRTNGSSLALTLDTSQNATFAGTIGSGAITSTGKIQGAELEGTSLDINGNGDVSGTLNVNGSLTTTSAGVNGNLYANRYFQNATGIPTNNLGDPTVTEMALFENQFTPKTTLANGYDDLEDLTFFTRATGTTEDDYAEVTSYSDDVKRKFLRTNNSGVIIPNGHNSFRVEFVGKGYTFANAMVAYWSSDSHNTQVHVWKRRCDNNTWYQHTTSSTTVSSWPGHLYLPFSTIGWYETNTTSSSHYNKIRIEFTPNWSGHETYGTRNITLNGMQIWGGYPSGKRTVHNYDQNGKLDLFKDIGLIDNGVATFGYSDALKIYHDGSNSYIDDSGTGNLKIRSNRLQLEKYTGETMAEFIADGGSSLYYDNAKKIETVTGGVTVTGELQADSLDIDGYGTIIQSNSSGASPTSDDVLTIERNGSSYLNIIAKNTNYSGVLFSDDARAIGNVLYNHSNNSMLFKTNTNLALTLDSSQNATFVGDIAVAGTVDGIDIATDVAANTAKTGITSGQASAITANTAKETNVVQTTITGNAGTVTNGVYTTGDQTIHGKKSFTGPTKIEQTWIYDMSAGSLDTTGFACAGLDSSSNGQSATFVFECGGSTGNSYQRIVYNCWNATGTWNTSKNVDEGGNKFDVTASANGSTITFTFKSRSGTQSYTPRVHVQAMGSAIVTTY